MANNPRFTPIETTAEAVAAKSRYFVDCHVWPTSDRLDVQGWLSNFMESELPYALNLLDKFMYFNLSLSDALMRAAFQSLTPDIVRSAGTREEAQRAWNNFKRSLRVTYVYGDVTNLTDSGKIYARKARTTLELPENLIVDPEEALRIAQIDLESKIIFVDDFSGTGDQMIETWARFRGKFNLDGERRFFFIPLLATESAIANIEAECRGLHVRPGGIINGQYSFTSEDSVLWPESLRDGAREALKKISLRAGIPESKWEGYEDLALGLAFWDSVPDATLPVFYWEENGWKPLARRM